MRKHYFVFAALLLSGCVSMGTNYDAEAVDRLRVGMTKAKVVDARAAQSGHYEFGWN